MLKRTALCLVLGVVGAVPACGSPSNNNFGDPAAAGSAVKGGASGSSGSSASGGVSGDSGSAGKGGSSSATGGSATGGTGGGDVGGTGVGGGDVGGTGMGGSAAQGGSSGAAAMGGTGMATGGTDPGTGGTMAMGGAGMATGGVGGGGRGGTGGKGGKANCDELAQQYAEALAAARACNAKSGKEQCTETTPSSLTCGCDVFVNPDNTEAVAELARLRKAGASCSMVCPAIACVLPDTGECAPDPSSPGVCQNAGPILN